MNHPEVPTQVGPYRLGELLGRGGMGEVYRAYDERLSRWVAVKQVRPDKQGGLQARSRLLREARAAAGLAHPAIVQIFDILDNEEGCWIVMELVDGQTLGSLLREGPMDVPVVARIGRQIAEGLAHAHEMGIVHRDLKVENVMLSTMGRTRILDFGLVKNLNETENTQTADGAILGTLRAMSPEQALGQAIDSRSDLFSLGTLLYECLSGVRPFAGPSAAATLQRVVGHVQEPVSRLNSEVPSNFSSLVDQLLAKTPESRPGATEVSERLLKIERLLESVDSQTAAELVAASLRRDPFHGGGNDLRDSTLGGEPEKAVPWSRTRTWRLGASLVIMLFIITAIVSLRPGSSAPGAAMLQPVNEPTSAPTDESVLPDSPFELYKKGLLLLEHEYRRGTLDDAVAMFEKLIAIEPGHAGAYAGLARCRLHQFNIDNDSIYQKLAVQAAEKAVELGNQLAVAHTSLGLVHLTTGNLEAVQESLERSLTLDPSSSLAHVAMGRLSLARKRIDDAESWFTKASLLEPPERLAFTELGMLLYSTGRYEEATAAFTQSRELAPGDATTLRNLGAALHMQGRIAEAASVLQESLVIEPRASVYNNLGTLFYFQGQFVDAARAFEKAVELGPNVYSRWASLADAYRWIAGKEEKAQEAYKVALELLGDQLEEDPHSSQLLSRASLYSAKLGDCPQEKDFSTRLDTKLVERGVVFFRIGVAAELCQQRDKALGHLERAMTLGYSREELTAEPELRSLRQDARFHRLVLGH